MKRFLNNREYWDFRHKYCNEMEIPINKDDNLEPEKCFVEKINDKFIFYTKEEFSKLFNE